MTNHEKAVHQAELPASVELAWGLRDGPRRGPKPGLTLERIVRAGIDVARADGIAAVSMARVAAELGVGTMSLYRYVSAKDDLISLMADAAVGPPRPAPGDEGGVNWRAGIARWATNLRESYHGDPWLLDVPVSAMMLGPNNVAWMESALRCLSRTPLSEQEKLSTTLLISGFVRNEATLSADILGQAGEATRQFAATLARLTDAERFPALHQAIASGALDDDDDMASEFAFGLSRILDGVAVLADAHRPQRSRSRRR